MLENLLSTRHAFQVDAEVTLLSCPKRWNTTDLERIALETVLENPVQNDISVYHRVIVKKKLIHSKEYERVTRRNSSCLVLKNGSFVIVNNICVTENRCLILYNKITVNEHRSILRDMQTGANASHIKIVTGISDDVNVCRPTDVKNKCIFINKGQLFPYSFICMFPNTVESD